MGTYIAGMGIYRDYYAFPNIIIQIEFLKSLYTLVFHVFPCSFLFASPFLG